MRSQHSTSLSRFGRDDGGNIAMMFGLAAPLVLSMIMGTVEFGRMSTEKARLQEAIDAATTALAPLAATTPADQLKLKAQAYLDARSQNSPYTVDSVQISPGGTELTINVHATYAPTLLKGGIFDSKVVDSVYRIDSTTKVVINKTTFEIALVMDNSGSMASSAGGKSKMQAAKDAANQLIDVMFNTAGSATRTKMSLVPFTLSVNTGTTSTTASWLDTQGKSSIHWQNFDLSGSWQPKSRFDLFSELGVSWGGCVEMRPGTWGTTDAAPISSQPDSYFVPQFAPDEPGDAASDRSYYQYGSNWWSYYAYDNSYLDDDKGKSSSTCKPLANDQVDAKQKRICKYKSASSSKNISNGRGPNWYCDARPLLHLTDKQTDLKSAVGAMVASGNTNLLEGFMWGWRTISPNAPFAEGRTYGTQDNKKILILLTDGMNAWNNAGNPNGSVYSPFGYYTNARLDPTNPPSDANEARSQIDKKTLEACSNAKAQGIQIYTIGFSVSSDPIDQKGLDLLKNCASATNMAYVANNSSQIMSVFQEIARSIGGLRIAQ